MGRPFAVKGLAIFAALSLPVPVARRIFCEAPGHARSVGLPVVRARGAHCKTAEHPAMREALALPVAGPLAVSRFANGRTACATALLPKARQLFRRWLSAQPFCRARPVRAPLAGKCFRTWQALRKEARGPATGMWHSPCARPSHWNAANPTAVFFYFLQKDLPQARKNMLQSWQLKGEVCPRTVEGRLCRGN